MSSSPPQSSSSASPGDLPQRIFAVDCYPGHVVRINSYSRPRYLIDILHILAGLPELQTLLASPLGKLFSLPVRYCSLSGQLVHQMLCRQLCTPHSDALWFVYGGQPLRFSLVEFEQLTGLSCAPSPPTTDILAATTHSEGSAPYWYTLIGRNIGEATVEDIVTLLKSEPTMPAWRKFRLALVVIVEGILLCRTQPVKPSIEVVEMVKDVAFFLHYPWGRHSFKRLIRMVTIGDYIPDKAALIKKLKQSSLAVHGFPLPIQLLAFRCIPLLTKFLPHSEDLSTFLDQTVTYLSKCKSYHTSNILSVEHDASLQVLFPFQADSEFCNTSTGDPREKLLESLVLSGYKFTNTVSFGGDASLPSLYSSSKRSKKALDCVQSVDDIVTLKLQDLKVALMADITELLITSNSEDHSLQSSEGTSSTSIFAEKRRQLSLQHSKPALHSLEDVSGSASASCFSSHDSSLEHVAFHASGKGREKLCFRDSVFSSSTDSNSIFCTSKLTCVGRLQCKKKKKIREVSSARSALLDDAMRYSRCRLALPCIGAAVPSSEAKNMFGSVSTCFSNSETHLPITENRFVLVDPPPDINHNVSGIDAVDDEPPPR